MSNSESIEIRLFLKKLLLFSLPVMAYLAMVFLCDPFDFLGGPRLISDAVKNKSARPLNPCLWKMPRFKHEPAANILLGDSRMEEVPAERVTGLTHEPYANLAYGGASLKECLETFWFANKQTQLHKVYFGVSFDMYNDYNVVDRTEAYRSMVANPALYFINRTVLQAMAISLYSVAFHKDPAIGAPNMTRQAFWNYEVYGPETTRLLQNYIYPVAYHAQLVELGKYVKQHGIELTFVIFPTHADLQARFAALGMEAQRERIGQDLAAIAPVVDFDYLNELTKNGQNFRDPVHLAAPAMREVADEIWGDRVRYAKRY